MRRIRAQCGEQRPKIVMLTADVLNESRQEALAAGADDFLAKPYEEDDLYATLERHLGIRFAREETSVATTPPAASDLTPADLAGLSAAVRTELVMAAVSLNHERIIAALGRVAAENAELAARLRRVAESMDYQQLWRILEIADTQ
jgi:CheY-like chemotaxis protein